MSRTGLRRMLSATTAIAVVWLGLGCGTKEGDAGATGAAGEAGPAAPTRTDLGPAESLPGIVLAITGVSGASGQDGTFQVGDRIAVTFTVKKGDGDRLPLDEVDSSAILVSGPSFNYQKVIGRQSDLHTAAVENDDGSYTYTFTTAIPATYAAPENDSTTFGTSDGELQGQALVAGTYTIGMQVYKNYTVGVKTYRDATSTTKDVLFLGAGVIESREVVKLDNCNQCHVRLEGHGGSRRGDIKYCLLCHTAGAEDKNVSSVASGTPGVTIDFRVMIHRIHNGAHLPSVLGVGTKTDGSRDYSVTPTAYEIVGYGNAIHDYSDYGFPVMPSAYVAYTFSSTGSTYTGARGNGPMPRDTGYGSLTATAQYKDDKIRTGMIACDKCHGDPDGSGSLTAPLQGTLAYTQPTRKACSSCHDDVDWTRPYTSNGQTMAAEYQDSACVNCHTSSGSTVAVEDAHLHPYSNPALNTGVNITLSSVGGGTGTSGKHQAGDPITMTFSVKDDAGANLEPTKLTRVQAIVNGPSSNPQILVRNTTFFDGFRQASPKTGNGSISGSNISVASTATAQTIAVVFASSTSFDVVGSVSAALTAQAIGSASGSTATITYAGTTFTVKQGSTAFASGDRFYFDAVPPASSYTIYVPDDLKWERVGTADGNAQVLTVGNAPLLWGRQTVYEQTAVSTTSSTIGAAAAAEAPYVVADLATLGGLAVGDKVLLAGSTSAQNEYVEVGYLETTDPTTGADLGASDRIWFKTTLRFAHATGSAITEVTLTSKKEGTAYSVTDSANGQITLVAGQFTNGNPVVVDYRTYGRFGFYRAPGDTRQSIYRGAPADSEDIDVAWGDWKGLPLVSGTYVVGLYANRDFSVTPLGVSTSFSSDPNQTSDNTNYRMISKAATKTFLYGSATEIEARAVISSGDDCNKCHGDIQAHGNGRRGLDTCLLCHTATGVEDGPKASFASWYVGATPGATMDFRTLLHKVHMGKELAYSSTYTVNGVFLGVPYPVQYEGGFPAMPSGTMDCKKCHGSSNTTYREPESRQHPTQYTSPVREWRGVCGSCHDSDDAAAHMELQTSNGYEACAVCHGSGAEHDVESMHKVR